MPITRKERMREWKEARQELVKAVFAGQGVYQIAYDRKVTPQSVYLKLKKEGIRFKDGKPYYVKEVKE